jgi:hypothetical protein
MIIRLTDLANDVPERAGEESISCTLFVVVSFITGVVTRAKIRITVIMVCKPENKGSRR